MSRTPEVGPWLKPLRITVPSRPRIPSATDATADDPDNLRAEEREARQEARFAALDRADRSGPTR